jgi:hypothetical protein
MLGRRRIRGAEMSMTITYVGYELSTQCKLLKNTRYSVSIRIEKKQNDQVLSALFTDKVISLILEVEAEKESINFGKNLIKKGQVYF